MDFAQDTEGESVPIITAQPATAGNEPWQMQMMSYPNPGAGAGTYNHGVWMGWNAALHANGTATPGKPSLLMGFEDGYFDNGGDNTNAVEWYVESWSPNGTTIKMSRPYYARGQHLDDGTNWWTVVSNIGANGPNRQFAVKAGAQSLFSIYPTSMVVRVGAQFVSVETTGNSVIGNSKVLQWRTANGGLCSVLQLNGGNSIYVGDIFGQSGQPVNLRGGGKTVATLLPEGFLGIAAMAGAPSVNPKLPAGQVALTYDTTTDTLYVFNGTAWKSVKCL